MFSLKSQKISIKDDLIMIISLNYSTFSLRGAALEKHIYYAIYSIFIELIDPSVRICAVDATA
jgi:hypothetical protein